MSINRIIKELRKDALYMDKEGTDKVLYAINILKDIRNSGHALVPKEPTEAMLEKAAWNNVDHWSGFPYAHIYKTMIEAAQEEDV